MSKPIFCIMGPTASGKTALACELINFFPFEIVSVDSAMIYRGMNIGTAKPSPELLLKAPHHLLDLLDPIESYSVAQFCQTISSLNEEIYDRGKIPLLVGGTMMYFHALQHGLSKLPEADLTIRSSILDDLQKHGSAKLHQQLQAIDPYYATKIHQNDSQRIQRALEVYYLTGRPLSSFLDMPKTQSTSQFFNFILYPKERHLLHANIALRFDQMITQGFVAEVDLLLKTWESIKTSTAMRAVGYQQIMAYLNNSYDYETMLQKSLAATRQLAKRQLTWLRHWKPAYFFPYDNPSSTHEIMAIIQQILDNLI